MRDWVDSHVPSCEGIGRGLISVRWENGRVVCDREKAEPSQARGGFTLPLSELF